MIYKRNLKKKFLNEEDYFEEFHRQKWRKVAQAIKAILDKLDKNENRTRKNCKKFINMHKPLVNKRK